MIIFICSAPVMSSVLTLITLLKDKVAEQEKIAQTGVGLIDELGKKNNATKEIQTYRDTIAGQSEKISHLLNDLDEIILELKFEF